MMPRSTVMAAVALGGVALAGTGMVATLKPPAIAQVPGEAPKAADASDFSRSQTANHMKLILLAFHNYADTYGHLPAAATYGPTGSPS